MKIIFVMFSAKCKFFIEFLGFYCFLYICTLMVSEDYISCALIILSFFHFTVSSTSFPSFDGFIFEGESKYCCKTWDEIGNS